MEIQGARSEWKVYTGKIPNPRPGTVNTHTFILEMKYRNGSPPRHPRTREMKQSSDPLGSVGGEDEGKQ